MIPEKGSIRGIARVTGHDKDTISKWLEIAGTHCFEVTKYFLKSQLNKSRGRRDSGIYKKQKNMKDDDPEEYGDVYSLTAMKSNTRLFLCHHEAGRTSEDSMSYLLWLNGCVQHHL